MNTTGDNTRSVCVVGVGATTAIGMTAPASAAAVRAGIAGFADHPYMIDQDGDPFVVARAPYLGDDIVGAERFLELLLPAVGEALDVLGELPQKKHLVPAIIGLPEERPGLPAELSSTLSVGLRDMSLKGCRISETQMIPKGHSAGLMAIEMGCEKILSGSAEFCLVGGVDSYLDPETLEWVEDNDQLHKTLNAWGFVPGEAAVGCLLCSSETAHRYELAVLGQIIAADTVHEKNRIKTETVCIGEGLSKVVSQVFQPLQSTGTQIDNTICDQNGEPYRADEFGFMLARNSEYFIDGSDFLAPSDCWGDVGAASGPLFVTLAVTAAKKRYAKGPNTLLWTSSEGGERSAVLLHAEMQTRRVA